MNEKEIITNLDLEAVIGLEIHAQISTKTKMFSGDSADYFSKEPNVTVSEISMGFPGQLPVTNKEAVIKGVKAAMALNCHINKESRFDRKNYFYPDLPKGYQISQFESPISEKGHLAININGVSKVIRITRLHLEEDAGKLTHFQGGSLIDFNRSGVGLMEIVSEPDISSAKEAVLYAKEVQMILRYVGSSDADMEKGMMRFDASVSLRPKEETKLYPRAEIKNLNSFRSLETAINFEISRQKKLWMENKIPDKDSTVGYDDTSGKTYFMRNKEGSDDYRYFPEPDLPPLFLDDELIERLRNDLPELPSQKKERYLNVFGLSESECLFLLEDFELNKYFDRVYAVCKDVKKSASFVLSLLLGLLKKNDVNFSDCKISAESLGELISIINSGIISMQIAKNEILEEMFITGKSPEAIIEQKGLKSNDDDKQIKDLCFKAIDENATIVADYKSGKEKAFGALVGSVMKLSNGSANPQKVNQFLKELLK